MVGSGGGEEVGEGFDGVIFVLVVWFSGPAVFGFVGTWPVDDECGIGGDGHVFPGPAIGLDDGSSAGDEASGWEGECGEDAIGSGDWDEG